MSVENNIAQSNTFDLGPTQAVGLQSDWRRFFGAGATNPMSALTGLNEKLVDPSQNLTKVKDVVDPSGGVPSRTETFRNTQSNPEGASLVTTLEKKLSGRSGIESNQPVKLFVNLPLVDLSGSPFSVSFNPGVIKNGGEAVIGVTVSYKPPGDGIQASFRAASVFEIETLALARQEFELNAKLRNGSLGILYKDGNNGRPDSLKVNTAVAFDIGGGDQAVIKGEFERKPEGDKYGGSVKIDFDGNASVTASGSREKDDTSGQLRFTFDL